MVGVLGGFFVDPSASTQYVQGTHNRVLVLLSVLVSVFSATMALQTAQIAQRAKSMLHRNVAIGTGAFALGGGIWSMHFIGMLAFELPVHIHYATGLTLLSLAPAFAASWLALRLLANPEVAWPQLITSGTLFGFGIGAMHYTGMAAIQTSLEVRYEPAPFLLSIAVAVCLAILALWVRYGLRRTALGPIKRAAASGLVMGLAMACMHYLGMAAVRFDGEPEYTVEGMLLNPTFASLALSTFTVTVTVLVAALNGLIRSRELYHKVEESKSRLRAILDTAVDGIITIDRHGVIQSFNHSAERLFGWMASEVIGHNIKMLMPEPDQSQHDSYLHNYQSTGEPKIIGTGREVMGLRKDGSLMPMRLAVGRVDLPNELLFVGFVTDISDRHILEASLRETAEQAERAASAKGTFLANMSHEIRTPMNSIIGFTELLLQGDLDLTQRRHLDTIRQSSRSLLRLINDILDTTKLEKGRLELESVDFSLKGLALQIESSLRLSVHAKHLTLDTHYPADLPEHYRGDPLRVLQVLTNLVGNAIKFTERGGVEVSFSREDGIVHIQVRDTGIGMTQQQLSTVFKQFPQADASISRRFGGTGLGTAISRQLVELMGGHIEAESTAGCGSTFHVYLPLPIGQPPPPPHLNQGRPPRPPLHILIADDVPQNLELLLLTLEGSGHQVVSANNGDEAIEHFTTQHFDVVLMDVHMPGTDGLQATRLIRQYERVNVRKQTPVIALTASVMAEDRHAALQAGMDGFAIKPLDVPRLFDEIARVLEHQAVPPERSVKEEPVRSTIDWLTGTTLWGSESRLVAALGQFLTTKPKKHPLPHAAMAEVDWEAAVFSLHGIRGAAGNLALPSVAKLAGSLEDTLRAGQREGLMPKIEELRTLLASVQRELATNSDELRRPTEPSLTDAPLSELPRLMQALSDVFARNELDDEGLGAVCRALELQGARAEAQALLTAAEGFEFGQAKALLDRLIAESSSSMRT
ncbi:PAS domain S-box protein [Pectobacterium betavasculorum]|uniref:MHYT domain-containing protein n=1 Tax=Pectobacterium betavasculorum TaxID=55207 RepID=UPI00313F3162